MVPDQKIAHVLQRHVRGNGPVHREQQTAMAFQDGIVHHVPHQSVAGHRFKFQAHALLISKKVSQRVVQIPLAGIDIVPATLDDGVMKVVRAKQVPAQHLLDLAVRLVPDGVVRADTLVDIEIVPAPAAVGHHLLQIVHGFHRLVQSAVGAHNPAVSAHREEIFDVV